MFFLLLQKGHVITDFYFFYIVLLEQLCLDIMTTAKEARKQTLGVFHPSFCLLRTVQRSLLDRIPIDAHLRASGKLCVSLTRLSDGENVLVSEFASREELIQVVCHKYEGAVCFWSSFFLTLVCLFRFSCAAAFSQFIVAQRLLHIVEW